MAERGNSRGGRGGGRGGRGGQQQGAQTERPKKENILDLSKYTDKKIIVKFSGGREIQGTLKGYDQLLNLVLDDVIEITRDDEGNSSSRTLGLLVARGPPLTSISPLDGSKEIPNPFNAGEEEEPVLG